MKNNCSNIPVENKLIKCVPVLNLQPTLIDKVDNLINQIPSIIRNSDTNLILYIGNEEYQALKPFIKKGKYKEFPIKIKNSIQKGRFWITPE